MERWDRRKYRGAGCPLNPVMYRKSPYTGVLWCPYTETINHIHDGYVHRLDGPAVEWEDGTKHWYENGCLHRLDGPAVEYDGGLKAWYVNGKRHRVDGPAIEWPDGEKEWYVNGCLHRLEGPAIERSTEKAWYVNGLLHRLDGPARIWDGDQGWYQYGKLHRLDGPAIEWADGSIDWYLNGTKVDISLIDYDGSRPLTEEERVLLILHS